MFLIAMGKGRSPERKGSRRCEGRKKKTPLSRSPSSQFSDGGEQKIGRGREGIDYQDSDATRFRVRESPSDEAGRKGG